MSELFPALVITALSLYIAKMCVIFRKAHRNSTGITEINYCCLTQNLLERSPQHVLAQRITVSVGTINPSFVESVSRLFFLSFTDLSGIGADATT